MPSRFSPVHASVHSCARSCSLINLVASLSLVALPPCSTNPRREDNLFLQTCVRFDSSLSFLGVNHAHHVVTYWNTDSILVVLVIHTCIILSGTRHRMIYIKWSTANPSASNQARGQASDIDDRTPKLHWELDCWTGLESVYILTTVAGWYELNTLVQLRGIQVAISSGNASLPPDSCWVTVLVS